jgi:hypothetical protein
VKTNVYFKIISSSVILKTRNVSHKSRRENQSTSFRFNNIFFFENPAVYEIMWENVVEPNRSQMAIWQYLSPPPTHTQSECVISVALPLQQWLRECDSLCYTHTLPVFFLIRCFENRKISDKNNAYCIQNRRFTICTSAVPNIINSEIYLARYTQVNFEITQIACRTSFKVSVIIVKFLYEILIKLSVNNSSMKFNDSIP